jgi:DNA invertase Pin-like site-specific DNA recombinase
MPATVSPISFMVAFATEYRQDEPPLYVRVRPPMDPIDTRSPTGKLMITMLGAIAEFERGFLLERQREGVAKARADGNTRAESRRHAPRPPR